MKSQVLGKLAFALLASTPALSVAHAHAYDLPKLKRDDPLGSDDASRWPSPRANGGKAWASAFAKANETVSQMTVEEMANLTVGIGGRCVGTTGSVPRFNIPELCLQDGPTGVRTAHGTSQFPGGVTVAATWDRELMYARAKAMGQEFHDQGVHVALAPVTGGPLGRSPREGRAWEGFFADPYATGVASYQSVAGILNSSVAPVAKHWIAYEQETFRNQYNQTESYSVFPASQQLPISSNLDDKTTHELYMWSFAEAVRAGTSHVMCSYNEVNQTHSCNNAYSLNQLLKTELNFQGSVISDWGAQWNNVETAKNGLDVGMPGSGWLQLWGSFWGPNMLDMVNNGTISKDDLADKVVRFLTGYYFLGQDTSPLPEVVFNGQSGYFDAVQGYRNVRQSTSAELIKEIGSSSVTLLKNTGGLPLKNPQRIAVVGNDAIDNALGPNGCGAGNDGCPLNNLNGTLSMGGGSGSSYAPYIITPLDALKQRAIETGAEIGAITTTNNFAEYRTTMSNLLPYADVTLVFVKRWSDEGFDLANLTLDDGADELIAHATNYSSNVVVVMHTTGAVDIEKWVDNENITAIVSAFLPGQESGASLVPVLYGDVSPSGKLPFTWGKTLEDYPPHTIVDDPVYAPQANFTEGVFIDYRWFDKKNITPRYEFGFGLSYTTFSYSDLKFDLNTRSDNTSVMETAESFEGSDGTNSLYDVLFVASAVITNTGNVTGSEVAQLYVSIPEEGEPVRMLRGFDKVKNISAGESATASFALTRKDLSVWSVTNQTWYIPKGDFTISVGASSRILPLNTTWTNS